MKNRIGRLVAHLGDDSGFRGPVLKLLTGTGFSFVLAYVAKTVLLRIYAPGDFGIYAAIFAMVGILTPLVTLRYEDAIMLAPTPKRSAHALVLALGVLVLFSTLFFGLIPARYAIEKLFGEPSLSDWIWLVPVVLFVQRMVKTLEIWITRAESFNLISMGHVVQSSVMTALRIGLGFVRPNPGGLIYGFAAGHLVQGLLYARPVFSSFRSAIGWTQGSPKGHIRPSMVRAMARRYRKFPIFTTPAAMIGAAVSQIPALLLLYYFDKDVLGIYSQSFAVLLIPLSQVSMVIAQVFFVRAVAARKDGTLDALSSNVHRRTVLMAWIPTSIVMVAGGDIFAFLFGAPWRASGEYLLYLGPWILLTAVTGPLTRLFDVLERQRYELAIAACMFIVLTGAMIIGGQTGIPERAILYLGLGGTLVRVVQLVLLMRLASVKAKRMIQPYLVYAVWSAPWLGVLFFVSTRTDGVITVLVAAGSAALFALHMVFRERLLHRR